MDPDAADKLRRAGRVSREARDVAVDAAREGALLLDVAEEVEDHIRKRGLEPAFPTCISLDDVAAHYSPVHDDTLRLRRGNVVKLDLGAHLDGWIADTAVTLEIGTQNWTGLIRASELALQTAIEAVHAGVETRLLGGAIQRAIESHGYKPIRNLTGHTIERFHLHAGKSVPNVPHGHDSLREGDVVAIEPFASAGSGQVDGRRSGNIYRILGKKDVGQSDVREFLSLLNSTFRTLPFAERWAYRLDRRAPGFLNQLVRSKAVMTYPALFDTGRGTVAQTEHTMIVLRGGAEVTTSSG